MRLAGGNKLRVVRMLIINNNQLEGGKRLPIGAGCHGFGQGLDAGSTNRVAVKVQILRMGHIKQMLLSSRVCIPASKGA